jgi:hypothetical protein
MYVAVNFCTLRAIIENRLPANNAGIGIQSQKVLAACYESAKKGKCIKIKA